MKNKIKYHIHKEISKMKVNVRYLKAFVIHLRTEKQASMVKMKKEKQDGEHRENWGEIRSMEDFCCSLLNEIEDLD